MKKKPAIFLDRDGVINEIIYNEETEQLDSPFRSEDFFLIDGAKEAIKQFKKKGYYVFVVTNQPAAAKGKTTVEAIQRVNHFMVEIIGEQYIDNVYTCFHHPKMSKWTKQKDLIVDCQCRKPKPGLLLQAAQEFGVDLKKSFMVGDSYTDVLAGKRAGVRTVFIGELKCDICNRLKDDKPDYIVRDLREFGEYVKEKL